MIQGIYELILRAPDGRERRTLAWLPTDAVREDYYNKARKHGLEVELRDINGNQNEK